MQCLVGAFKVSVQTNLQGGHHAEAIIEIVSASGGSDHLGAIRMESERLPVAMKMLQVKAAATIAMNG
ncbi:hypothetical protein GN244_ATG15055 [Phytophthora infestans]|nr:hypothetical protein GN244_ATG15055 [Phytophthora infestans]KAF4127582.1 hypothetical protein GN958_ATG23211 [Phytophthora infestans]